MIKIVTAAFFFLAAGILTSVTILSAYQILFSLALFYYTYLAFKNKQYSLPKSSWWLLAFVVIAVISLFINFDIVPKPMKNFGRIKYYLFGILGIYVLRVWIPESSSRVKTFLANTFFFSVIVAGGYAISDFFIGLDDRAQGFTDTMRYGYGSAMFLLTLLSALLHHKEIKDWFDWKWGATAFLVGFVGMYLTHTRGAMIGFICGLPFVIFYFKKKLGYIAFAGVLVLSVALYGFYVSNTSTPSPSNNLNSKTQGSSRFLTSNNKSNAMRKSQWQSAIIAIKEKPLLGWGLSNFHTQVERIKIQNDLEEKDFIDSHAHNLFLEIGSGTGLIGLFLFIGWIISWAWESFTSQGLIRAMVIPFGVAFIISSQFEVTFDANNASMIFFLYALSSSLVMSQRSRNLNSLVS